jgi:hypothetical protein
MKSNVCKIEKGTKDLSAILRESEKVAVYNELDHKQTMHLRLLCEELDGMLPEIIGDFDGDLWFEMENGVCRLNVSIELAELNRQNKDQLLEVAKNKINAAAVGVIGKIRASIENFFLDEDVAEGFALTVGNFNMVSGDFYHGVDYSHYWSLKQYRSAVKQEEQSEAWDELEKSVIASVADDIIIGIKGKHADIIIIKKFA